MAAHGLAEAVLDALPQTQCRRCGYADCQRYAEAIVAEGAAINRCPPGGAAGVARLALVTGRARLPLDPECGREAPRSLAVIDESACIGCALCLQACPVDAIVGAAKRMHVVIAAHCTGCELCIPVWSRQDRSETEDHAVALRYEHMAIRDLLARHRDRVRIREQGVAVARIGERGSPLQGLQARPLCLKRGPDDNVGHLAIHGPPTPRDRACTSR